MSKSYRTRGFGTGGSSVGINSEQTRVLPESYLLPRVSQLSFLTFCTLVNEIMVVKPYSDGISDLVLPLCRTPAFIFV